MEPHKEERGSGSIQGDYGKRNERYKEGKEIEKKKYRWMNDSNFV